MTLKAPFVSGDSTLDLYEIEFLVDFQSSEAEVLSSSLEVESGGLVAAYGSVIDNMTQDPVLVKAQLLQN